MKQYLTARAIGAFVAIALFQLFGFPLISRLFDLGDKLQAPSWIVILLTSGLIAAALEYSWQPKRR